RTNVKNEVTQRLKNQVGVSYNQAKRNRIALETHYAILVEKGYLSLDDIKSIQSSSINQSMIDLGQKSDIVQLPMQASISGYNREALRHNKAGDKQGYMSNVMSSNAMNWFNLFIGGRFNLLILTAQSSLLGLGSGVATYS